MRLEAPLTRPNGSVTAWTYDHRNRLTQVSQRTAAGVVTRQTNFTCDVFDRRIAKTADLDGTGPALLTTTTFLYDGDHVWADGDGAGNITARYLYGDGIDELLARTNPGFVGGGRPRLTPMDSQS